MMPTLKDIFFNLGSLIFEFFVGFFGHYITYSGAFLHAFLVNSRESCLNDLKYSVFTWVGNTVHQ